mmetsp:Transcript_9588/g.19081  ORF Transcript_9588/g.19081 Transcript_9588/m.19081 type:complete len:90 (+) Transcript_9588:510-779(+)
MTVISVSTALIFVFQIMVAPSHHTNSRENLDFATKLAWAFRLATSTGSMALFCVGSGLTSKFLNLHCSLSLRRESASKPIRATAETLGM